MVNDKNKTQRSSKTQLLRTKLHLVMPKTHRESEQPWRKIEQPGDRGMPRVATWSVVPTTVQLWSPMLPGPFRFTSLLRPWLFLNCGTYYSLFVLGVFGHSLLASLIHKASTSSSTLMIWLINLKFANKLKTSKTTRNRRNRSINHIIIHFNHSETLK